MFKGSLLKYVKLLDTPFLVGYKEENGEDTSEEKEEKKALPEEESTSKVEFNPLAEKERLQEEIRLLEDKLRSLSIESQGLLDKAKKEAEVVKKKAEEEAKHLSQKLLEEARKEAEAIKEEAYKKGLKEGYDKGFAQGYAEGVKEGKAQYEELLTLLKGMIDEIKSSKEKLLGEIEPEVIAIIKIVLRKLLLREIKLDEELVLRVVKSAVKKLEERSKIVLRVNPDDLPKVVEKREELFRSIEGLKELDIVEDPRVGKGGCIVEGGVGVVDARIERQIEEVEKFIDKILREGRGEEVA